MFHDFFKNVFGYCLLPEPENTLSNETQTSNMNKCLYFSLMPNLFLQWGPKTFSHSPFYPHSNPAKFRVSVTGPVSPRQLPCQNTHLTLRFPHPSPTLTIISHCDSLG